MLGWLPGSWSVPGRSAAGHGAGKVPSDPAGAHQAGDDGHFCLVGTCARAWLGRGEGWPQTLPQPMLRPLKCTSGSQPIPMPGAACGPGRTSAHCWCLLNWYFPFSGHQSRHLPSSAMSHSIYSLPAPLTWVIRIYVLIGINTKMGVTAINSQAPLRKILSRAVLSPAWPCTMAQGARRSRQESAPAASLPQPGAVP